MSFDESINQIYHGAMSLKDISLRAYQMEAKGKICKAWDEVNDVMYQMPTGTGKTKLFVSLIRDLVLEGIKQGTDPKVLVIAHRTELIDQISEHLSKYHLQHGILSGSHKAKRDLSQRVIVASIQTISHRANREEALSLDVKYIIIDEAHHSTAETYKLLWQLYPKAKKLGVTATPWRMNGEGFNKLYDTFINSMPVSQFIKEGWLAEYNYYSIPYNSSLQNLVNGISKLDIDGDYAVSELEETFDRDYIRAKLLNSYLSIAKGKKGIIYSISISHSKHICAQYAAQGIRIIDIDCSTPASLRKEIVENFKKGRYDIIVNVDIFSEGFDCPDIEFIQLARPTKSLTKYLQQVGRGLRKNKDKTCIILDNVGLYNRFGLPDKLRDWVRYFNGQAIEEVLHLNKISPNNIFDIRESEPIEEGDEKLVLIQGKDEKPTQPLFVISDSFCKGEYYLKEDLDGLYIVNVRSKREQFLYKPKVFYLNKIELDVINSSLILIYKINNDIRTRIGYILKSGDVIRFRKAGIKAEYTKIYI